MKNSYSLRKILKEMTMDMSQLSLQTSWEENQMRWKELSMKKHHNKVLTSSPQTPVQTSKPILGSIIIIYDYVYDC